MSDRLPDSLRQLHAAINAVTALHGHLLQELSEFREWRRSEVALFKLEREEQLKHAQAMTVLLAGINAADQAKQQETAQNERERKRKAEQQPEPDPFAYTPMHKYT